MGPNQTPTNDKPNEQNGPVPADESFDQPKAEGAEQIQPSMPEATSDFVPTPAEPTTDASTDTANPLGAQPAYPEDDNQAAATQTSDFASAEPTADATVTPEAPEASTPATDATPVVADATGDQPQAATPVATTSGDTPPSSPNNPKKRTFIKTLVIAVVAVAVIGGGSAAAYFGVIVPNQPENVLLASVANSLQQTEGGFDGTLTGDPIKEGSTAFKMAFNGEGNIDKKIAKMNTKVTVSGVDISAEMRYVDQNLYVKMGDLKTVTSLLQSASPIYGSIVESLNAQIANKWISVDSTLIKQAGSDCVLNANTKLTDKDLDTLLEQYKKHPFTTISSVTDDTVDGKKVQKFVLKLDDDKMAEFAKQLRGITPIKSLLACDTKNTWDPSSIADHDITPVTLWIDKSNKQIVQFSSHTTAQDEKDMDYKMSTTIKFNKKTADVKAPASSTPIMQLLGNLGNGLNDQTTATDFSSI